MAKLKSSNIQMLLGRHRCSCVAFLMMVAMILIAFLSASQYPSELFLPVLGGSLLTDRTALRDGDQLIAYGSSDHIQIQDVVKLPENEALMLVKLPPSYQLPDKQELSCIYDDGSTSQVVAMDQSHNGDRAGIRCGLPSSFSGTVGLKRLDEDTPQELEYAADAEILNGNRLVFDAVPTPEDVVLFAKGIVTRRGYNVNVKKLSCIFGGIVETKVSHASQEVFRCAHPPTLTTGSLRGRKVSIKFNGSHFPSVARYGHETWSRDQVASSKHLLCACTMVYNISKFLKEWVIYHAYLGVNRFFFYDNNSEDDLEKVLHDLEAYNVSRHFWPWIKSQEAGFSHCALRAQTECTWMAYIDVDEFIFPKAWLGKSKSLARLVEDVSDTGDKSITWWSKFPWKFLRSNKPVGQIFLGCHVFGPSGLQKHPRDGVTQGYTCRMKKTQRHKSIVKLEAVDKSLLNVVHHFNLRPEYASVSVPVSKAVIQHYKYQVWNEFKAKFKRRVSTYVTDWKKAKNLDSKDRTPGLGTEDVEPRNWKLRFCEVNDTAIRRYVRKTFGARKEHGGLRMPWV